MRQVLLGTAVMGLASALATAPASAEVKKIQLALYGYFTGGMAYSDVDEVEGLESSFENVLFGSDSEIHFRGSTVLDNGLKISFRAELELERDGGQDQNDVDDIIDEVYVQVDGGYGRVQFGQQDGVADQMIVSAPNVFSEVTISSIDMDPVESQYRTISNETGDLNENNRIDTSPDFSQDFTKLIYITPRIAGFQVGVSYTPVRGKTGTGFRVNDGNEDNPVPNNVLDDSFGNNFVEAAANFKYDFANGLGVAVSTSYGLGDGGDTTGEDPKEWHVGGQLEFSGFTLGGAYKNANVSGIPNVEDTQMIDAGVTYEVGPWTFGVAYGDAEGIRDDEEDGTDVDDFLNQQAVIGGLSYKFGPGRVPPMEIGFGGMFFSDRSDVVDRDTGKIIARAPEVEAVSVFTQIDVNF